MTTPALHHRRDATGLWRETPDAQRREVIVALGEATLTISALNETALSHWSLPAVVRRNPGRMPALYAPGEDSGEQLELSDTAMVAAIEDLRGAIERARPHPGRLRLWLSVTALAATLVAGVVWLPSALTRQTVAMMPDASRAEIGERLLAEVIRISGPPCATPRGLTALSSLAERSLGPGAPRIVIFPSGVPDTISLPGNMILARATLVEDYEAPDVLAGYLIAAQRRATLQDPMLSLLEAQGLGATLQVLTRGHIDEALLHRHAADLLSRPQEPLSAAELVPEFASARISTQPYAFSRDMSGETTLDLIEADPMRGTQTEALLSDADWISLRDICAD
jgi:hypothetical protein